MKLLKLSDPGGIENLHIISHQKDLLKWYKIVCIWLNGKLNEHLPVRVMFNYCHFVYLQAAKGIT